MRRHLIALSALLFAFSVAHAAQNSNSPAAQTSANRNAGTPGKRGPVFRANKEQIKQAQMILKQRGFYSADQTGKLDDATRDALRKYQQAEGLKVTGTLNKVTLEKMNIVLTEKQRAM